MARSSQDEAPAGQQGPAGAAELPSQAGDLLALIDKLVEDVAAGRGEQELTQGEDPYSRAFPLGESLARRFGARCRLGEGPHGLALLLQHLLEPHSDGGLARARARRGLYAGFCWEIEQSLADRPRATASQSPVDSGDALPRKCS
jgi:hypothetical protein